MPLTVLQCPCPELSDDTCGNCPIMSRKGSLAPVSERGRYVGPDREFQPFTPERLLNAGIDPHLGTYFY